MPYLLFYNKQMKLHVTTDWLTHSLTDRQMFRYKSAVRK